jgi:glutamate carboxypeptidase
MSEILSYLQTRQEAMTRLLGQLVMLESPSSNWDACNAVAGCLAHAFDQLGARVDRLQQTESGDHLRIAWGRGDPQVLLLGHMDTVWPIGETGRRPFRVEQGKGMGPGVFDMKGGLVVGLYALTALCDLDIAPPCRLVFILNSDEEVGSPTSRPFIEGEAKRSDAVLVLEPSREEAVVTWRKGVGRFELKILGKASHSGAAHEQGVSAIQELAHQILCLEAMTDYAQGSTVNVGLIQGGSKVNVRPASAQAEVDLRVTTAEEAERLAEAILGLEAVDSRVRLSVSGGINRPPWQFSPKGDVLFERARRVAARLGLDLWPAGSGGGSDGNFAAALGVPTLDGLGVVGDDAHALTEWVDLDSLPRRAALLAELLLELAE